MISPASHQRLTRSSPAPGSAAILSSARSRAYVFTSCTLSATAAVVNARFLAWIAAAGGRSVAGVIAGARTPEELDLLYEDAFVLGDTARLCSLHADGAVVVTSEDGE